MTTPEIQMAIQNRDFKSIQSRVEEHPEFLWQPRGYSIMHLASRMMKAEQISTLDWTNETPASRTLRNLSFPSYMVRPVPSTDWWKWILTQASSVQPEKFFRAQDHGGESCLDIFMSSWLTDEEERDTQMSFTDAVEEALETKEDLRKAVADPDLRSRLESFKNQSTRDKAVVQVARVYQALAMMCQAADPSIPVVHFLAQIGSCPEPFARIAVAVAPADVHRLHDGYLPIHLWAVSPRCADSDKDGMIRPLLEAYPDSALSGIIDDQGRLPIHSALEHGKQLDKIKILWETHPSMLSVFDPISELPCCALVALACRRATRFMRRNFERRSKSLSLSEWLETTRDIERLEDNIKAEQLSYIYEVLRAFPSIVQGLQR